MIQHRKFPPIPACLATAKSVLAAAVLSTALVVGGCAKSVPAPVVNPQPLALNTLARAWAAETHSQYGQVDRLHVRENFVFAYTRTGNAYILARDDGRIITVASVRHGREQLRAPVVLKDRIVFPTNSSLEIYDRTGGFITSKDVRYSIRSDAVGTGNFVFFGADFTNGGRVVKVDITKPYVDNVWELMFAHASVAAAPAILGDAVYCGGGNGDVTAVTMDDREPIWSLPQGVFRTYGAITADLIADETGLYVASGDGKLVCLNRSNGRVKWQYTGGRALTDMPRVTKDFVFQQVPGTGLVALSKTEGEFNRKPRWVASDITQFLAEDEAYVYGRREDNAILAMEKATGRAAFASKRRDFIAFAPNTTTGIVYAVTKAGRIMAIRPVLTPGEVGEVVFAPVANDSIALAQVP